MVQGALRAACAIHVHASAAWQPALLLLEARELLTVHCTCGVQQEVWRMVCLPAIGPSTIRCDSPSFLVALGLHICQPLY
jgi:hypothetical protein